MTSLLKDLDAQSSSDSESSRRHVIWIKSSILEAVINNQDIQEQQGEVNEIIDPITSPKNIGSSSDSSKKGSLIKSLPSIRTGISRKSVASSLLSRPSIPSNDDMTKFSIDTNTTYGDTDSTVASNKRANDAADAAFGWGWVMAVLLSQKDDIITIMVEDKDCPRCDNMMIEIPTTMVQDGDIVDDSSSINDDESDNVRRRPVSDENLTNLSHMNEPSIIHQLRKRYDAGQIHTSAGSTLLMIVNPFKHLGGDYYSLEAINKYWMRGMDREQQEQQQQLFEQQQYYMIDDDQYSSSSSSSTTFGPHVFGTADFIFRNMTKKAALLKKQQTNKRASINRRSSMKQLPNNKNITTANQSIIINGTSASGKTVTAKFLLFYLTITSERRRKSSTITSSSASISSCTLSHYSHSTITLQSLGGLQQKILSFGTILESYGNARTRSNDNSSRYSSVVTLNYATTTTVRGDGDGELMMVGATIATIAFEKERVTLQGEGERNFHIFYELMSCVTSDEKDRLSQQRARLFHLRLRNGNAASSDGSTLLHPDDFKITSCSGTYDRSRDGVDDEGRFHSLVMAMETIGMEGRERDRILMATASLLHLGNLSFDVVGRNRSKVAMENASLKSVLSLLGVDYDMLNEALCYTYVETSTSSSGSPASISQTSNKRQLNVVQSTVNLEALTKGLFHAIFDYLVDRINELINVDNRKGTRLRQQQKDNEEIGSSSISIVDILEFNSFHYNSFDQFCINYCKEVLQQQFIQEMLKNRQSQYSQEGIEWDLISYQDNLDLLDLIDNDATGIISLLERACQRTAHNDESNKKLFEKFFYDQCHGRKRLSVSPQQKGKHEFVLEHYAGYVEYSLTDFVEKNSGRDRLSTKAIDMLQSSTQPLIKTLAIRMKTANDNVSSSSSAEMTRQASSPGVIGCLKRQIQDLRKKLDASSSYYIRCLKPNDDFRSDWFEPRRIDEQLRGTGIVEALRIGHARYPHVLLHTTFIKRYKLLAPRIPRKGRFNSTKDICETFVNVLGTDLLTDGETQIGRTKIFMKDEAFDKIECLRLELLNKASCVFQMIVRGFLMRRRWQNTLRDLLEMPYLPRGYSPRLLIQLLRRKRAATTVSKYFRRFVAMRRLEDKKRSVIVIQRAWRQYYNQRRKQQHEQSSRSAFSMSQIVDDERDRLAKEVERLRRELEISRRQQQSLSVLNLDLCSSVSTQPSRDDRIRSSNSSPVDVHSSLTGGDSIMSTQPSRDRVQSNNYSHPQVRFSITGEDSTTLTQPSRDDGVQSDSSGHPQVRFSITGEHSTMSTQPSRDDGVQSDSSSHVDEHSSTTSGNSTVSTQPSRDRGVRSDDSHVDEHSSTTSGDSTVSTQPSRDRGVRSDNSHVDEHSSTTGGDSTMSTQPSRDRVQSSNNRHVGVHLSAVGSLEMSTQPSLERALRSINSLVDVHSSKGGGDNTFSIESLSYCSKRKAPMLFGISSTILKIARRTCCIG